MEKANSKEGLIRIKGKMWDVDVDVGCGMWDVGCGMWDVGCGMWDVGCGMWDVGCEM
jgi:hypothetical protein